MNQVNRKSPLLAAFLSLLIAGAGQCYAGHWGRGILLFLGTVTMVFVLGPLAIIILVIAIVDAYHLTQRHNAGLNHKP